MNLRTPQPCPRTSATLDMPEDASFPSPLIPSAPAEKHFIPRTLVVNNPELLIIVQRGIHDVCPRRRLASTSADSMQGPLTGVIAGVLEQLVTAYVSDWR